MENTLGYREVIPAGLVEHVSPDMNNTKGFIISLRGAGFIGTGVDEFFEAENRTDI
jgi:hypothetical protein